MKLCSSIIGLNASLIHLTHFHKKHISILLTVNQFLMAIFDGVFFLKCDELLISRHSLLFEEHRGWMSRFISFMHRDPGLSFNNSDFNVFAMQLITFEKLLKDLEDSNLRRIYFLWEFFTADSGDEFMRVNFHTDELSLEEVIFLPPLGSIGGKKFDESWVKICEITNLLGKVISFLKNIPREIVDTAFLFPDSKDKEGYFLLLPLLLSEVVNQNTLLIRRNFFRYEQYRE